MTMVALVARDTMLELEMLSEEETWLLLRVAVVAVTQLVESNAENACKSSSQGSVQRP